MSSYATFVFDVIATFLLAAGLLWRYCDVFRQPLVVTVAVLTAWYFSFLIIFAIPLDVASTIFTNCTLQFNQVTNITNSTSQDLVGNITSINDRPNQDLVGNLTSPKENIIANETSTPVPTSSLLVTHPESVIRNDSISSVCGGNQLPQDLFLSLWRVLYWSSQVLTWLVLPTMQSFTQAGEFTVVGKLKSSLWDNMIYYTSYLLIAIILLIYIATQPGLHLTWARLKAIAASASNTWGLCLLVLAMGYGLVEVPRGLWSASQRGHSLNLAYFRLSKLWGERSDAEGRLEEVLTSLEAIGRVVQGELSKQRVDTIVSKVPQELLQRVRRRGRVEAAMEPGDSLGADEEERALSKINKQVLVALTAHKRTQAQWGDLVERVLVLEDEFRNLSSNDRTFKRQEGSPDKTQLERFLLTPSIEWYLRCWLKPMVLKGLAVVSMCMSLLLTWSEVTFFSERPTLSVFALILQAGAYNLDYSAIQLVSFLTLCYMCVCTYYTLFRVRVLNYYYLAPRQQSDPYTLLFSGALLCRLTPPLCLNFLSVVHMDSHVIPSFPMLETAYTRVMGHMDVVSIVQDYFNIYFPMLLLLLTLATYFSLGSRILSLLGFQQFMDREEEQTSELVEEGKELVRREKRRRERLGQGDAGSREREREEVRQVQGQHMRQQEATRLRQTHGSEPALGDTHQPYSGRIEDLQEGGARGRQPPRNLFDDI